MIRKSPGYVAYGGSFAEIHPYFRRYVSVRNLKFRSIYNRKISLVFRFALNFIRIEISVEPRKCIQYSNNLNATLNLCDVMRAHGCKTIIFSSSATVYGDPAEIPITENCPMGVRTNPYGESKAMQERILTDIWKSDPEWKVMLLRYFNPIGAHESGLIGEDPKGIPNNLLPYVAQVASGKLEKVHVFGDDYDTPDGTGVRDYIHVVDLAKGHVKAIEGMEKMDGVNVFNLGTGVGYSVLDIIHAFEKACGKRLPYVIDPRRPGDIATCYSDPSKAEKILGWKAEKNIEDMCRDAWNWQTKNPDGYGD